MLSLIYDLFGSYSPVTYSDTSLVWDSVNEEFITIVNDVIPSGLAGVDWPWIAGVFLFAIMLHGLLRIIGGCVCRG